MKFTANKSNILRIILVVILIALTAGVIFSVVKIVNLDSTKKLNSLNYQVGAIDSDTGKYIKDTGYIVTKDFITLDGLKVTLKKDAGVEVFVALFNKKGDLIAADTNNSQTFLNLEPSADNEVSWTFNKDNYGSEDDYKPVNAAIMIRPLYDSEVSFTEISGYAKQVTVEFNK